MSPHVALHDPKLVVWNVKLSYVPASPRPKLYTICPGPRPGFTPYVPVPVPVPVPVLPHPFRR